MTGRSEGKSGIVREWRKGRWESRKAGSKNSCSSFFFFMSSGRGGRGGGNEKRQFMLSPKRGDDCGMTMSLRVV